MHLLLLKLLWNSIPFDIYFNVFIINKALAYFLAPTGQAEELVLKNAQSDRAFKDSWCVFVRSDRPGVMQHRVIDELQEILALTLKSYISVKRSGPEKQ